MELKRAAELSICALLKEAISDLDFYPSRGGGDDVTPLWTANHVYRIGDIIRPTDLTLKKAVVVTVGGNSGATQPTFLDITGTIYTVGGVVYQTIDGLAIPEIIDAGNPEPPFAVVSIDDGEKTMAQEETDFLNGVVVWVTRADSTDVVTHSTNFKRIYDAMTKIGSGYDIMRRITIHGIDISSTGEFTDSGRKAHGDTIVFVMGVSEKPAQV